MVAERDAGTLLFVERLDSEMLLVSTASQDRRANVPEARNDQTEMQESYVRKSRKLKTTSEKGRW